MQIEAGVFLAFNASSHIDKIFTKFRIFHLNSLYTTLQFVKQICNL